MGSSVHLGDRDTEAALPSASHLDEVVRSVKPRLRGWLHAGTAPLALVAGIVLVGLAPTSTGLIGGVVFLIASACSSAQWALSPLLEPAG